MGIIIRFINFFKKVKVYSSIDLIELCDVLFFCHDVDRPISLEGKAYSPLVDSLVEDLEGRGLKCISISHPWSRLTGKRGFNSPISINESFFIAKFGNRLKRFELPLFICDSSSLFRKILLKAKPKVVITIGCTDELCYQARLLKVFHLELLHGIGYTSVPWGWDKKETQYLPQGILALDQVSAVSFSPLTNRGINVRVIPHPFLKRFMPSGAVNLPKEWIPNINNHKKWKKEILLSLQWSYAGDHGHYTQFANILKNGLFFEVIESLIAGDKEIFWRFRFHPVQLRSKKYKHLLKYMDDFIERYPNTEWRESSTLPFPSIVMLCDANISMSSMSCYDAASFGVQSLMLCPTLQPGSIGQDRFLDLEKEGYIIKSKPDFNIIKTWIYDAKKIKPRLSNMEDKESWESTLNWFLNSKNSVKE
jgi:hypothetical protein